MLVVQVASLHGGGTTPRICVSRSMLASRPWVQRHAAAGMARQHRMLTTAQAKQKGKQKEDSASQCSDTDEPRQTYKRMHRHHTGCLSNPAGPYKDTVNLPQTKFNMRANSVQREPELQRFWEQHRVYEMLLETNPGVSSQDLRVSLFSPCYICLH